MVNPFWSPSVSPSPSPTETPTPSPTATPAPTPSENSGGRFDERYSGTLNPGQAFVSIPFDLRRSRLEAQINQNHGNQQVTLELADEHGNLIAVAEDNKLIRDGLAAGRYVYRVRGSVTRAVDFTIKSGQGR